VIWKALVAVLGAGTGVDVGQPMASFQKDMVLIDGRKEPHRLPEWLVWEESFRTLALTSKDPRSAFRLGPPELTPEETEVIYREALAQAERDRQCLKRQHDLAATMKELPPSTHPDVKRITIDCRWRTLEARDRVLHALSAESALVVHAWVSRARAAITSYVPKGELDFFWLPQ
jgi:hypothetical protein